MQNGGNLSAENRPQDCEQELPVPTLLVDAHEHDPWERIVYMHADEDGAAFAARQDWSWLW